MHAPEKKDSENDEKENSNDTNVDKADVLAKQRALNEQHGELVNATAHSFIDNISSSSSSPSYVAIACALYDAIRRGTEILFYGRYGFCDHRSFNMRMVRFIFSHFVQHATAASGSTIKKEK